MSATNGDNLIDEFFYKQPEPKFIEWLKSPLHEDESTHFIRKRKNTKEADAFEAYICECAKDFSEVIKTATDDFHKFLRSEGALGNRYPIYIQRAEGFSEESYRISVTENECTVYASDTEGARRAVYYLEEEMIKREGAFLPLGDTVRTSRIKRRITRGFFSPTNRPPKFGDELFDDIDYYPDEYLNRLAHDGTNGIWIYTSFRALLKSDIFPEHGDGAEKRIEKLRRVIEKCKRYGIKVFVFAIEPMHLVGDMAETYSDLTGAVT